MPMVGEIFHCEYICIHKDVVERVQHSMPHENTLFDLSELFKVFGDSTRIRILYCLFVSDMCVCDIATLLHMTQSAISHQLAVLKRSKLVSARREGKTVFYALSDDHVRSMINQGIEHVTE